MDRKAKTLKRILQTVSNFKMQSMFIKLFLIVLFTSLLFTVVHFGSMIYINRVMLEKETSAQVVYMDYSISLINNQIADIRNDINSIVVDAYFMETLQLYSRKLDSYYQMTDIRNNLKKLHTIKTGNSAVQHIYVYMDLFHYVATADGVTTGDLYLQNRYQDETEQWMQRFQNVSRLNIVSTHVYDLSGQKFQTICVLNSLYLDARKIGTIVVEADLDEIIRQSAFKDFASDRIIYLMDADGIVICSLSQQRDDESIGRFRLASAGQDAVIHEDYLVRTEKTSAGPLYLVVMTPMRLITGSVSSVFQLTTLIIALTFIIGVILAFYFSQRIYTPVLKILDFVRTFGLARYHWRGSEFDYIEKNMTGILEDNKNMGRAIEGSIPLIIEAIFKKIIVSEKDLVTIQALVKELSIDFKPGFYLVVLIRVAGSDHEISRDETEFFIQVRLFQMIKTSFTTTVISVFKTKEDEVTVVLFIDDQSGYATVLQSCVQLNEILTEEHPFTCMIGVGGLYSTVYDVDQSYLNAIQAIEHCPVGAIRTISVYSPDAPVSDDGAFIPNDLENRLCQYVTSGSSAIVNDVIEDVLTKNYQNGVSHTAYRKVLLSLQGYAGRLFETIPQNIRDSHLQFENIYTEDVLDISQMKCIVLNNYQRITDYYRQASHQDLFKRILEYIDQNLHRDIGLKDVADTVGLTPNYLTQYFKKQKGVTFSYYISHERVKKARQLLEKTDQTVKSIASQCGYNSSNQFIVTFSRITGMTPMEYKRQALFLAQKNVE